MKLLVLIDDYPSDTNRYSNVFAHVRVKGYQSNGAEVKVCITSPFKKVANYDFEGVSVSGSANISEIKSTITTFEPDAILVHFALGRIIRSILLKNTTIPTMVWVHGYEALGWYRRLFNFHPLKPISYFKLASMITQNTLQLIQFRRLIGFANNNSHVSFIFVSEWMKNIAATDCLKQINRYEIVGNPIDDRLFSFTEKTADMRFNWLMIRPFNSKKYATDLVTEALLEIKVKYPEIYKRLNITVYGKGSRSSKLFHELGADENIQVHDTFLKQKDIKKEHDLNGVFLALSRQDAQGVSMCEAMSSGLLVVSSNNTAIPEYVPHNVAGLLTTNEIPHIVEELKHIIENPDLFLRLSRSGAAFIQEKVGFEQIVNREMFLVKQLIEKK